MLLPLPGGIGSGDREEAGCRPGRGEEGEQVALRLAVEMAGGVPDEGDRDQRLRQRIVPVMDLQKGLLLLAAFAGGLLGGFVARHLFVEIAFSLAAGGAFATDAVDAKISGDEIPIDLVFDDQAPFAEGLKADQQDQYYRYRVF